MLITITPTITAELYTANDCVGGKLTLAGAIRDARGYSLLQTFTILDLAMQNAAMSVYLFKEDPAAGTYTDGAELDIHDTDFALCIGCFNVGAGDYLSAKDNSVACVSNIGILCSPTSGTTLYAVMKTTGAPTWATTSDLKLIFAFRRDIW